MTKKKTKTKIIPGKAEARLAEAIKQHSIQVTFGKTNGRVVLHISNRSLAGKPGSFKPWKGSFTIRTEADWEEHPWKKYIEKKKHKHEDRDVLAAVANREAI